MSDTTDGEPYLRATDSPENYGCEIPLDADYHITDDAVGTGAYIAWHAEDDIDDDLKDDGNSKAARDVETDYDGHAFVTDVDIVYRDPDEDGEGADMVRHSFSPSESSDEGDFAEKLRETARDANIGHHTVVETDRGDHTHALVIQHAFGDGHSSTNVTRGDIGALEDVTEKGVRYICTYTKEVAEDKYPDVAKAIDEESPATILFFHEDR